MSLTRIPKKPTSIPPHQNKYRDVCRTFLLSPNGQWLSSLLTDCQGSICSATTSQRSVKILCQKPMEGGDIEEIHLLLPTKALCSYEKKKLRSQLGFPDLSAN